MNMQKEAVLTASAHVCDSRKAARPPNRSWSRFRRLLGSLTGAAIPLLLLGAWSLVARWQWIKPIFLPSPATVLGTFWEMVRHEALLGDLWTSISTVGIGFFWGALLGLLFGSAAGLYQPVDRLSGPLLNGLRQVPAIAWFPLIVLWVGIGDLAKEVVIAKSVFFPVFMNTLQGIRGISPEYVEMGRVFGFTRGQLLRRVVLPAALPTIFVGIRFAAGLSWAMIVVAEMLSGRKGLGFLLQQSQELLLTDHLFVVIVSIGIIGFVIDVCLRRLERQFFRWKRQAL